MKEITEILDRKEQGQDCTEAESAEIKGFIKETLVQPGSKEQALIKRIQILFPQEYGEAIDEVEDGVYLVIEEHGGPEYAVICTDEEGKNLIFKNHGIAVRHAEEECQDGRVVTLS